MSNLFTKATVDDFKLAYDDIEFTLLNDPATAYLDEDSASAVPAIDDRIQLALDDADCELSSYYIRALAMGRAMIRNNYRRLQLRIARYLLDTVKSRESVKQDYEKAIEFLDKVVELKDNLVLTKEEAEDLQVEVKNSNRLSFASQPRTWTVDTLSVFRRGQVLG